MLTGILTSAIVCIFVLWEAQRFGFHAFCIHRKEENNSLPSESSGNEGRREQGGYIYVNERKS